MRGRSFWQGGLAVAATLIIAGCSGGAATPTLAPTSAPVASSSAAAPATPTAAPATPTSAPAPASITFWVRAANEAKSKAIAAGYNATHTTKVVVTSFPDDSYVARIATATASGDVPDVLATDSVYMTQFIPTHVFLDITTRVKALSFYNQLFPSLMKISTDASGAIYAVPRDPGTSTLFWNKDLFTKAGLDPNKAPSTWAEIEQDAKKITALGGTTKGFYFAGNCAGCLAYTMLPLVWANGGDVVDSSGAPTFTDPQVAATLSFYNRLWVDGVVPASAKTDNGSNWLTGFQAGTIGIEPLGSFAIGALRSGNPKLNFGVGPLPGNTGGQSAFIGGDVIGIPAASKNVDAAWDFISWTLSDQAQKQFVAAAGELVVRSDLLQDNQNDPQAMACNQAVASGKTPTSVVYNQLFNDANGPWVGMVQQAVFKGDVTGAVQKAQTLGSTIFANKP